MDALLGAIFDFYRRPGEETPKQQDESTRSEDRQARSAVKSDAGKTGRDVEKAIWNCAGILGLHPGRFTLGQLMVMAESRDKQAWGHTSQVLCFVANGLMTKRSGSRFTAAELNPYAKQKQPAKLSPTEGVNLLAKLMGGN
jgi:hypothetical protein